MFFFKVPSGKTARVLHWLHIASPPTLLQKPLALPWAGNTTENLTSAMHDQTHRPPPPPDRSRELNPKTKMNTQWLERLTLVFPFVSQCWRDLFSSPGVGGWPRFCHSCVWIHISTSFVFPSPKDAHREPQASPSGVAAACGLTAPPAVALWVWKGQSSSSAQQCEQLSNNWHFQVIYL